MPDQKEDAERTTDRFVAIPIQARRYLLEPGDGPWHEVVRALSEAFGEDETDELLRAIKVRMRTGSIS